MRRVLTAAKYLPSTKGIHVAIIMDGNGRWATSLGQPRAEGHRAGAQSVRRIVEAAPSVGVQALTLYAFSRDNWSRPADEVENLMMLLREFIDSEQQRCLREGVRMQVIGSRQRLDYALLKSIAAAESATAHGTRLDLRIALDYSSRDAILAAARRYLGHQRQNPDGLSQYLAGDGSTRPVPNVDLLIRTGGEQRLSDFLLWECAYAELYFTSVLWPDFSDTDFRQAVHEFHRRERRFGKIENASPAAKEYWLR
ncbi:MAG: polyprenyl diphosphate synthase [Candidatus Hydrogenedentes bacterium]|nr:polyprenyl diphosphate synthase [Candidatus Hydrogenedentota bacterium]